MLLHGFTLSVSSEGWGKPSCDGDICHTCLRQQKGWRVPCMAPICCFRFGQLRSRATTGHLLVPWAAHRALTQRCPSRGTAGPHPACSVPLHGNRWMLQSQPPRRWQGGRETDGNGEESGPDSLESKKSQESLIAGAKMLTWLRGREGRRRRVALPSLE